MPAPRHSTALLTVQPQRRMLQFQAAGLRPRLLAFQRPVPWPVHGRWQILPQASAQLIIDLSGLGAISTAMLLADLQHVPEASSGRLIILVPQQSLAVQRLLHVSSLHGLILPTDMPPALLSEWLSAPLAPLSTLVWVGIQPPGPPTPNHHLVPLLAALAHADTVLEAAGWCYLSARRAYEVLATSARQLSLPSRPRRQARQWAAALNRALAAPPLVPDGPRKDSGMDGHPFEVIAATLCGCVIERIHTGSDTLTIDVEEPRQGRLSLRCQGAALLNPPEEYADLAELSMWERRIDWADIVAEDIIALYLADERCLLLRLAAGRFERDTTAS